VRAYSYMIKIKLLLALSYRFEFFTALFSRFILLFVMAFFWKAAYNGLDVVEMVNERQMLTYSVISMIMSGVFSISVESSIRNRVRKGDVAVDFIKPVNIFLMYLSEDVGSSVTEIVKTAIPVLICSALFIVIPAPSSFLNFILFLASSLLSYSILWLISAIFGLFYFWVIDLGPIGAVKDYLIAILSGAFIPIWFFPQTIQTILKYLPFTYTYQHPLKIYIGRATVEEALIGMGIQLLWVLIFFVSFKLLKKRVEKNILVQGG